MWPFKAKPKRAPLKLSRFFWVCFDAMLQEAMFANARRNAAEGKGLVVDADVSLLCDSMSGILHRLIISTPAEENEPRIVRGCPVAQVVDLRGAGDCSGGSKN